jgi:hypothetical protein
MHIRMLRKPPCEVRYDSFTYRVEPKSDGDTTSYISAQLLNANGRLWEPKHEHELTRRFAESEGAKNAWQVGFEAKREYFLPRSLIDRLVDEGEAELIGEDAAVALKGQFPMV